MDTLHTELYTPPPGEIRVAAPLPAWVAGSAGSAGSLALASRSLALVLAPPPRSDLAILAALVLDTGLGPDRLST